MASRPRRDRQGVRRRTSLAALLSLVFHAIAVPIMAWLLFARILIIPPTQQSETVTISSATRLEKTTRPLPRNITKVVVPAPARPEPRPTARARPPRPELAKQAPEASPQPSAAPERPESFARQLARQQAQFAKTAQRLHAQNDPLSVATPNGPPATIHRQFINEMGQNHQTTYFAFLTPNKHWFDGAWSCYYVDYAMSTNTGGTEDGSIPWPVCYPRNHDAMLPLDRPHNLPVPLPPRGYAAPAGFYMAPFLKSIYEGSPHG